MKKSNYLNALVMSAVVGATALLTACDNKSAWDKVSESAPSTATEAALYLHQEAKTFNEDELNKLASALVNTRDLPFIKQLTDELIYKTRDKQDNKLAVFIAEQGYLVKNDPILANRAGLEYKTGRFVTKDYDKAASILGSPALKKASVAKFYLAEVLLAEDNPKRDPATGKALLVESANAGVEAAQKKLQEIN
ncbi:MULTISPECIES: hypothetical protein [Pseudomonas]|uniref:hypothetical protein n=1 Tax=Pseudomonas TaxID=286 RepID=UPI001596CBCD|nr:hypothetical protein [Pseudomonas faucium]